MWPIISFLKCLCVECRVFRERLTFLWFTLDHTHEATLILKEILGDQYHASSEPAFLFYGVITASVSLWKTMVSDNEFMTLCRLYNCR